MKVGKYAKTLAKIQVRGVFPIRDSLRSMAVLSSRAHERRSRGRRNLRAKHARTSGEAARKIKLLPPQSPRGFSALARLYYLARPTKTAMQRRLYARYPKKCFTQIYRDLYIWRRHAGAHPVEHQRGGRLNRNICYRVCYKSVNLFFEELINIKVILFQIHRTVWIAKFPEISFFVF